MRPSAKAWIGLGAYVIVWDWTCADGEMLSEASARYAKKHPVVAYAVVGSVAAHLVNKIPKQFDPIHGVGVALRAWKR
jgi:hypothetical protein